MMRVDVSLYLILGPELAAPLDIARAAVGGGVTLIQWRDKNGSTAEQVAAVRALVAAVNVPVIVNDRADVALVAGAAGVHVGHGDLTPLQARLIVGSDAIVGLTVHNMAEAIAADGAPISYASVGGVFETHSKVNPNRPIGIDGFRAIAGQLKAQAAIPVCAIAGITPERAATLVAAGADGVAVISAIVRAVDARAAAEELAAVVRGDWAQRGDAAARARSPAMRAAATWNGGRP